MTVTVTKPQATLRELLAGLKKKTGLFGEQVMRTETAADFYSIIGNNRNWLINGNTEISQRGDFSSASDWPNNTYGPDRWKCDRNINCSLQHVVVNAAPLTPNSTSTKAIKLTATNSGSAYMGAAQYVEHYANLAGKFITLSAWVRSNTPEVRLTWYDAGAYFVSSPHSGNGTWERLSVTGLVSTNASQGRFAIYACNSTISNTAIVSGQYFEFTDAQLEVGKVLTPFERRPYGTELMLCQRYYEEYIFPGTNGYNDIVFQATAGNFCRGSIPYKVTKRAAPSIGLVGTLVAYNSTDNVATPVSLNLTLGSTTNASIRLLLDSSNLVAGNASCLAAYPSAAKFTFNSEI